MRLPSPLIILFWICMIAAPFAVTAVALACLPPGISEIPMQVGFDGQVHRTAPPSDLWVLSFVMGGCNGLMALCYCANDFLWAHGLVNGVRRRSTALKIYAVLAIFLITLQAACTAFLISLA